MSTPPLFRGLVIVTTGRFGAARTLSKIKTWIKTHGGAVADQVDDETTHLIASQNQYKANVPAVKAARSYVNVKIVSIEWLEDCIKDQKVLGPDDYSPRARIRDKIEFKAKAKGRKNKMICEEVTKYRNNCKEAEKRIFSDGYHIYEDPAGVQYDVTLVRVELTSNSILRFTLKLYESHVSPRMYAMQVEYAGAGKDKGKPEMLAALGTSFEDAIRTWRAAFKEKTGIDWEDRQTATKSTHAREGFVYLPSKQPTESKEPCPQETATAMIQTGLDNSEDDETKLVTTDSDDDAERLIDDGDD